MKKALLTLMCLTAMMAASTSLKAQEVTIVLTPGWNWISHPSTDTVDFATAFGSFTPATGDVIKSRWGQAFYTNNRWMGSISQFYPGYGYMYKSNRMMPILVTFNVQQPAPQVVVTTSEPMMITAISAMGGGEVTVSDGTYILVRGLCWATHENPTTNEDFFEEAESGVGSFSLSMTGLNISTTYYVRAYAVTGNGTVYGDQKTFTTRDGIPTLTTSEVTNITGESATSGGNITDNGGLNVTARGVCWSTSPNPTVADSYTTNGSGSGGFSSSVTGLSVSTTYYVRAYATTNAGTAYGNEMSFTTRDGIPSVTTADVTNIGMLCALCGGVVTNDGGVTVTRGVCWSTAPNPTINDSHTLDGSGLGNFSSYMSGLNYSTTYFVRAYATTNYVTTYGEEVSFTTLELPEGAIDGLFSVSSFKQVYFSQGNLQYIGSASMPYWKFAEHQWEYLGYSQEGDEQNLDRDLFGWGTSGYNHGAICYQPWSTSTNYSDYYAYGIETCNLYDQSGMADWGSNVVCNGGNESNQWRTLTINEWQYVFYSRSTTSGIRFVKANVNNVNGVLLLPDNWNENFYYLNNTNPANWESSYNDNIISETQWSILENAGAIFLPAAGDRLGTSLLEGGTAGYYWSSTCPIGYAHCHLLFGDEVFGMSNGRLRWCGLSVRLVCDAD